MSEEIKDIILDVKDSLNETPKNMYKYNKITLNLNEFEKILNYIEQLENIINEAKEECKSVIGNPEHTIVSKNELMKLMLNTLNKGDNK